MAIQLGLISSVNDLDAVRELYINSFPANERREFNELVLQLNNPLFKIFYVDFKSVIIGFITTWNFTEFSFIEHFAIKPRYRGKGFGTLAMQKYMDENRKHLLLEVEPPIDLVSKKRVKFYSKFGFVILPQVYIQPSYSSNKPAVEMRLMTNYLAASAEWINQCISTITCNVYL